ncbi:cryptococcal mannosyltransferase 1-domain-containing protein [Lophiotrema nucula]|uniref:Cryptococcal mannosyltransferase 1-domain-containing protein n=1 Tax=Lophiotrema nucula TaxID=690887 RepID=A0A6A5Z6C9_9PLEO|nr:cryptococcal mannosyltransferase 1-domain-containing protein [Lophiotrema nucula]
MAPIPHPSETYELLPRRSSDYTQASDTDVGHFAAPAKRSIQLRLVFRSWVRHCFATFRGKHSRLGSQIRRRRNRTICCVFPLLACCIVALVVFTFLFLPSYTYPPQHYKALQRLCLESSRLGRGNVNNEKVFIAAALYDPGGKLVDGDWGNAILRLVELLGPANVYLSVYENDADPSANEALEKFKGRLSCNSSIVSEHLPLEDIGRVIIPTGDERIKRIAFLAEVRNRALRPLQTNPTVAYDRLLYINDVMFNPIDAIHLLFSTNIDASGRAQYGAVCAVDFINAFKFYDRFATRDFEGYEMGVPFFPWFTDAGDGISRQDVLNQKDAVRVRACWGGMTAFEAKWFMETIQESTGTSSKPTAAFSVSPLRFRYEEDPFWDASECCLIHADLTYLRHGRNATSDSGIFTNPYVRVAYDSRTLRWLPLTRRFERLYSIVHNILNHQVGLPKLNVRRLEQPGEEVIEKVWTWDKKTQTHEGGARPDLEGSYHDIKRVARPGRFCGGRALLVMNDDPKPGERKWTGVPIPAFPE